MSPRRVAALLGSVTIVATVLSVPVAASSTPGLVPGATTLSGSARGAEYDVVVAADGTAHAVWAEATNGTSILMSASRRPGGAWTRPQPVDRGSTTADSEPSIAVDGRGDVVAAWRDDLPDYGGSTIRTATLTDGAWSASRRVSSTSASAFEPAVATNARGDAAISFTSSRAGGVDRFLAVAQRPVGGRWTAADVPGSLGAYETTVAMLPRGRVVVLWRQSGTVLASERALTGDTWSPSTMLSPNSGSELQAEVDGDGRVVALWRATSSSNVNTVETATRDSSGAWSETNVLASTSTGLPWQLDLDLADRGEAVAAWVQSGTGNTTSTLWTAHRQTSGGWTTAEVDSPQVYNSEPATGLGRDGSAVLLWVGSTEQLTTSYTLYIATRGAGGKWTTPDVLSTGYASDPTVAVNTEHLGTILWLESTSVLRTQAFDDEAPRIERFGVPRFARTREATSYATTATDAWAAPAVTWVFDGGPSVRGSHVTHRFREAGVHRVSVTATDAALNSTTREGTTIVSDRAPRLRGVELDVSDLPAPGTGVEISAHLSYWLTAPALVRLQVHDRRGRVVATLRQAQDAGRRFLVLTAEDAGLRPGRYTVRVLARNGTGADSSPAFALSVGR